MSADKEKKSKQQIVSNKSEHAGRYSDTNRDLYGPWYRRWIGRLMCFLKRK